MCLPCGSLVTGLYTLLRSEWMDAPNRKYCAPFVLMSKPIAITRPQPHLAPEINDLVRHLQSRRTVVNELAQNNAIGGMFAGRAPLCCPTFQIQTRLKR